MKVLIAVCAIVSSVSALGSGPYLPSGWRPDGPAFFLPSEPRPPVAVPPIDLILQGSEASGSDFLREYGPPKIQRLPEVATEQSFVMLEAKFSEEKEAEDSAEVVEAATEVIDLKYNAVDDAVPATETVEIEEATETVQEQTEQPTVEGKSLKLEVEASEAEETDDSSQTEVATQQEGGAEESSVVGEVQAVLVKEVNAVEEGVKNIAEAIVSLEKEVVAEQVQISQDLKEVKSVEQTLGSVEQIPEGFLEYGPPGFKEYGPPNVIPRSADDVKSEAEKIDSNETRRRRFSPKFRYTKPKKH